ncbi:hypothetical protein DYU11_30280 [Fibrisoma montanum]|uniref:Lipocalin-like domain-containing protein n=1 Tax=Fibrisoma montanum TaxID=2305895 RepID=A0A418LXN9_9BACT|nr:hypothetical protein [Fibrisoma montanum]RIV17995.1 hypothetical protein DYU11_30280 [Fibrisoma montanum]
MRIGLYLFLLFGTGFVACKASEEVNPDELSGTWVEASARKDTISFLSTLGREPTRWLQVNRGKTTNPDGYIVPRLGSGIYDYYVSGRQMYVRSLLSSNSAYKAYPISRRNGELRLGNFFELGSQQPHTTVRTLVRL